MKHALAYLRLLANPDDDTSFLRVVNFPARGIGARSVEALQDAAQAHGVSLWQAAAELGGKPGAAVGAFVQARSPRCATARRGCRWPRSSSTSSRRAGSSRTTQAEREGADRVENLGELVNAAAAFEQDEGAAAQFAADARRGRRRAGRSAQRVPRARRARVGRGPGGRRRRRGPADDGALGEGARVPRGVHQRARGRALPARAERHRGRRPGGGAPPDVRRAHAGAHPALPLVRAIAPAPRPDALRPREPLPRRAAEGGAEVADARRRGRGSTSGPGAPRSRRRG